MQVTSQARIQGRQPIIIRFDSYFCEISENVRVDVSRSRTPFIPRPLVYAHAHIFVLILLLMPMLIDV